MELLFGFVIVIAVITVVGHFIWWMLATIFRALLGEPAKPAETISLNTRCVECGTLLRIGDDFCHSCGRWQVVRTESEPLASLKIAARLMDSLLNQGKLDLQTHRAVMKAIEDERDRLINPQGHQPKEEIREEIPTPRPETVVEPLVKPQAIVVETVPQTVVQNSLPATSKSVEPTPAIDSVVAEPPASDFQAEPRRSLTEMLATFMEESSIRWGELVGGLLIIGCSLALVISLWTQIAAVPLLKFSVFAGLTAGLFGIGFYSAHRWKLPTTSRGALIISTLLVPINFLAMTAFSQTAAPNSPVIIGGELIALLTFAILVYQAAKVIAPGDSWLMTGASLLPSLGMLMAKHLQTDLMATVCLGLAPLAFYWLGAGAMLRRSKEEDVDDEVNRTYTLFGIASFAALIPVGLLLVKSGNLADSLQSFSPIVTLVGMPSIAAGLTLRKRAVESAGMTKTIATSIAIMGGMLATTGLVLAWPRPLLVMVIALINCAVCVAIAWRSDLKRAHYAAIAFFALAYLIGWNLLIGDYPSWSEDSRRLHASLWSKTSGLAWMSLFVLFAFIADLYRRNERKAESRIYEFAVVTAAFFSLLILSLHGWGRVGDPNHLTLVYGFYAVAAFVIAWHRNQFISTWIGLSLSLLSIAQAFVFKFGYSLSQHHPVRLSVLTFASLATISAAVLRKSDDKIQRVFVRPATTSALIGSVAVAPFILFGGWMTMEQLFIRSLWLAAIWLTLSVLNRWPILFTAFQAALSFGAVCGVAAIFDARALPSHLSWSDPLRLQAQGIALALISLVWIGLRIRIRGDRFSRRDSNDEPMATADASGFSQLLFPPWPTVDRMVTALVWGLLVALCLRGIGGELVRDFISFETARPVAGDFALRVQGAGSWLLALALALVFVAGLWEQFQKRAVLAIISLLACACALLAMRWPVGGTTMSSLRWLSAIGFALVAVPIIFRNRIRRICERFNWPQMNERAKGLASLARDESLALFAAPVLLLTAILFLSSTPALTLSGKLIFLAPLVVVSLTLAAHAIRERSPIYAIASGLLLNLAATLGVFFDRDSHPITLIQVNIIVSAVFSIVWLELWRRLSAKDSQSDTAPSQILRRLIAATLLGSLVLLAFADLRLSLSPEVTSLSVAKIGNRLGWAATLLSAAAWFDLRRHQTGNLFAGIRVSHFGIALLAVVSLLIASLSRYANGWTTLHFIMIGLAASSWLMLALRHSSLSVVARFVQLQPDRNDESLVWATGFGLAQFLITVRGIPATDDVWWTVGSFGLLSFLFASLAVATVSRAYVYLSGILCNLIAVRLFVEHYDWLSKFENFICVNVTVLALSSLAWLRLDLALARRGGKSNALPFHRLAAAVSLIAIAAITGLRWIDNLGGLTGRGNTWLPWVTLISVALLFVASSWDGKNLWALRGLHMTGLVMIVSACLLPGYSGHRLLTETTISISLSILMTAILWRRRDSLSRLAASLRISISDDLPERMWLWLIDISKVLTAFVAFSIGTIVFDVGSLWLRLSATTAVFVVPVSFALLARADKTGRLITISLRLGLLNLLFWCWAWLSPVGGWQAINRLVIVMLIAAGVLAVYRLVIAQRLSVESEWRKCLRFDLPMIAICGLASLALVLAAEVFNYATWGGVLISWPAIVAVLLTLIGLGLISIAFAVLPDEDPFNLNERGRMRYVYAAEIIVVLTFMHLRLTMPWLFSGFFTAYWPIIVLLLAFVGLGLAEFFRRQGRMVLAEPLGRTGAFMPLLPVIGFWAVNSDVPYSGLLLLVGVFYGIVSVMRRSFAFGLLAALAGNSGLWHFLNNVDGLRFFEHPQLWLIPMALSILLAARINRQSLSQEQTSLIRYGALIVIYVSSTADIFLNGVVDSPWLPIILAVLSVCGVMAGLMLRVRSFLFLGTAFLMLSMLTMIWSASANLGWTWLWYVMGIAFGVFIIYTVAMFERKRVEMLGFIERLKQWQ